MTSPTRRPRPRCSPSFVELGRRDPGRRPQRRVSTSRSCCATCRTTRSWQPSAVFDTLELGLPALPRCRRLQAGRPGPLRLRTRPRRRAPRHARRRGDGRAVHRPHAAASPSASTRSAQDIAAEIRRARESYNRAEQGDRMEDIRRRHGIGSAAHGRPDQGHRPRAGAAARTSASTAATRRPSARSASRSASCRAPTAPGSSQRGQTQALSIATLGPSSDVQRIDTISPETEKRYMHHYNFPPYSVGEATSMRGPGRREIGHGALAERALLPVLPTAEEFPYAIRVVSEVVSSNGSTSMASDLWLDPGAHGCRRADQGAGRRCGDGPHHRHGHRPLRRPDRHQRQGRRLRRHGLQGGRAPPRASPRCRWTSRSPASPTAIMRDALEQARDGPALHPGQDDRGHQRQPRASCRRTRRASRPSRSRSTRSATSSAPAAR